jgi:hypothetical protein
MCFAPDWDVLSAPEATFHSSAARLAPLLNEFGTGTNVCRPWTGAQIDVRRPSYQAAALNPSRRSYL